MPDSATLSAAARNAEGLYADVNLSGGAGAGGQALALPDLLAALKNGQFSPAALLQLIAMLSGGGMPGQAMPGAAPAEAPSPIESAYMGQ